jgi:hypothetical protein
MLRSALAVALSALLLTGCARHRDAARPNAGATKRLYEREAREAAIEWLELVDSGEYEDALDREPARIRAGVTASQFVRSMRARRAPFGHAISRTLVGTGYSRRLTGAPDANYESLLFKTSFQHKRLAAERVILVDDHGTWRVVDYRVY